MSSLYYFSDCPYCFRLRVFLAERDVGYTSILCERQNLPPELPGYAPLRKLPVWLTQSGKPLFGSRTIAAYVDQLAPGEPLFPSDPLQRARVDMALDLIDEGLLAALLRLDRLTRGQEPGQWDLAAYDREVREVRQWLDVFGQLLGDRKWLIGDRMTPADLALIQPLAILERYGLDLSHQPALAHLLARLDRRPAVQLARRS